jgi:TPR repeat protein
MQLQLGIDASPDHRAAATWLRRAARHGHRESQLTLGMLYQNCDAESRDYVESVAWLRTTAEGGHPIAMSILSGLYAAGRGVIKDPVLASMWHFLAAYRSSGRNRDQMVRMAELMARALTRVERREALRLAAEWDAAHPQ